MQEIGRIAVQGQLRKNVSETPSQLIKGWCGGACLMSLLCKKHKWEDHGPGLPQHESETLFGKYLKAKKAGGMVPVVEHLPSKCKA
jgi:hypothetical protein